MDVWTIAVVMALMRVHGRGANFSNEPRYVCGQNSLHLHPLRMSIFTKNNYRGNSFMQEPVASDLCEGSHMKTLETRLSGNICSSDVNLHRRCQIQTLREGGARSSRPLDGGGGGLQKTFFRPFVLQFGLKIRGGGWAPRTPPGSATDRGQFSAEKEV